MKPKRKPIAQGDKVWILRDNPIEHGPPGVVEGKVSFVGMSQRKRIYNCTDVKCGQKNIILDKDTVRPFTNKGKAELLRVLVHRLNGRSHHYRTLSNYLLDLIGIFSKEIADLEEPRKK